MIASALSTKNNYYPGINSLKSFEPKKYYDNNNVDFVDSFFVNTTKAFPITKDVPKTKLLKEMYVDSALRTQAKIDSQDRNKKIKNKPKQANIKQVSYKDYKLMQTH